MGGGLMQLVAYGAQDIYLTGNPQITFFKVVYRRHTNFSMETISQSLDGNATIGTSQNEASCTISRNGDLIHKMYITVLSANSTGINFGSEIVQSAELEIGGQKIDKHTAEWNNVWNELSLTNSKAYGLKSMMSENMVITTDKPRMVQVPLNFFFCRNFGLALPLIALQYHEVIINFVFGTTLETGAIASSPVKFYVDYIYLDTDERKRFAQVSHEYLIEQVQMQNMTTDTSQELNFNHPVKELIFLTNKTNVYGAALLKLNGHTRFEKQEEEYFQLRQPFDYHTSIPKNNLPLTAQVSHELQTAHYTQIFPNSRVPQHGYGGIELDDSINTDGGTIKAGYVGATNKYIITQHADDAIIDSNENLTLATSGDIFYLFNNIVIPETISGEPTFKLDHTYRFSFSATDPAGDPRNINIGDLMNKVPTHGTRHIGAVNSPSILNGMTITQDVVATMDSVIGGSTGFENTSANWTIVQFNRRMENLSLVNIGSRYGQYTYPDVFGDVKAEYFTRIFMVIVEIHEIISEHASVDTARTSNLDKKINVYSFALKPEEHQPSGTCNFSRIDTATLEFDTAPTGSNGHIYAINYNVLRIMSGMGGLAYSN